MDLFRLLLPVQLFLLAGGLAALTLWPPAEGRLLAVPLDRTTPGVLLNAAAATSATLVGRGPLGGLVIEGNRARLGAALAGHRVLLLAAPRGACGDRA